MTAADELEDLLNKENHVILAGRLSDLESLAIRKTALFEAITSKNGVSPAQLRKLAELAVRNASLLEASGRGVKAAIRHIEEANALSDQTFYGPDGERTKMTPKPEKLQQKV